MRDEIFSGSVYRDLSIPTLDDFVQPSILWNYWDAAKKTTFVNNVAEHLKVVKSEAIKSLQVDVFKFVDTDLGDRIEQAIKPPN